MSRQTVTLNKRNEVDSVQDEEYRTQDRSLWDAAQQTASLVESNNSLQTTASAATVCFAWAAVLGHCCHAVNARLAVTYRVKTFWQGGEGLFIGKSGRSRWILSHMLNYKDCELKCIKNCVQSITVSGNTSETCYNREVSPSTAFLSILSTPIPMTVVFWVFQLSHWCCSIVYTGHEPQWFLSRQSQSMANSQAGIFGIYILPHSYLVDMAEPVHGYRTNVH